MTSAGMRDEVYVSPGEFRFAGTGARFHTLLGSCVSITLWHPRLYIGGICHFLLPARVTPIARGKLDGRYADDSIQLFLGEIKKRKTRPEDYLAKVFGGSNMFPLHRKEGCIDVGWRNIEAARGLLARSGFRIVAEDVGGNTHRRLIFDLADGNVWIKQDKKSVLSDIC